MIRQHSITETYVLVGDVNNSCMMLHPRDSRDEVELTLYPSLRSALGSIDRQVEEFFEENEGCKLVGTNQFYSPEYKLSVFDEGRPSMTDVRDITRVLTYQSE